MLLYSIERGTGYICMWASKWRLTNMLLDWESASYVIVNTTYANMYSMEEYSELKQEYVMLDDISSYGNIVCEVYRRN